MAKSVVHRFETLIETNTQLSLHYQDVRALLSLVLDSAEKLIGTDASSILLQDEFTGQLYFEAALGEKKEQIKNYSLNSNEGIAGWVFQNNRSVIVNDAKNDCRHCKRIGEKLGYLTRNLIAVPLRSQNDVTGVLEVINKKDNRLFDTEDLKFLEILAEQASAAIRNAREFGQLQNELNRFKTPGPAEHDAQNAGFIWKSPLTGKILEEADRMARADAPVLIFGDSGAGKEMIAERIHSHSPRAKAPFIKVNCAAIPQDLAAAELFGYVKGAFTDALRDKSGYFEQADKGTLFLDEVAELSSETQGKLLRVLQNGCFQRVGAETETVSDVRIIAASNKKIESDNCWLRKDLYYRLAVLILELPPLRERPEDIEILANHFLAEFGGMHSGAPEKFSLDALGSLISHSWPGNVRELRNAVERAVITGRGKSEISAADLGFHTHSEYHGKKLKDSVILFKKNLILEALNTHNGNQTLTAGTLGIQRSYLSRMIKELNIGETHV